MRKQLTVVAAIVLSLG